MKKMKTLATTSALAVVLIGTSLTFVAEAQMSATPLVPLEETFEAVGSQVIWEQETGEISITRNDLNITLRVGSSQAEKNGVLFDLDKPVALTDGKLMISSSDVYELAGTRNVEEIPAFTYTVREGDTMSVIAAMNRATPEDIRAWNEMGEYELLTIGQPLKLYPSTSSSPQEESSVEPQKSGLDDAVFPLLDGTYKKFGNTYGDGRSYGGNRKHEGNDILAEKGTPLFSATDGVIVEKGWNEFGGWRLNIQVEGTETVLYYAHLADYVHGLEVGDKVEKGQMIGYIGDSGYGKAGTTGKFVSHLHFGAYDVSSGKYDAFDPHTYLKTWEQQMNEE